MLKYTYKALTTEGKVVQGRINATGEDDFNKVLAEKGLRAFWFSTTGKKDVDNFKHLDTVLVLTFCRQLSSMLTAGLPLSKSLEMLYERTEKPKLKAALAILFEGVQKGNSLAESMVVMGEAFPALLISMIKSGEMSGQLEATLLRMADHYEKTRKQEQKIKSALSYPKMLGGILILVVGAMIQFILPNMVGMIEDPAAIPAPTRFLMGIKTFVTSNFIMIIVVVVGFFIFKPIITRVDGVKMFFAKLKIKMPLIGKLNKQVYTSRFASSLSTLCSSGVSLLDAMNMCSEMMGNALISKQLDSAIEAIRRGESISSSLQNIEAFDQLLMTMIFVGEESGSLEQILAQTATYFEGESNEAISRLTGMINPLMTLIMGLVVGFCLIAIMMPMFSSYDQM